MIFCTRKSTVWLPKRASLPQGAYLPAVSRTPARQGWPVHGAAWARSAGGLLSAGRSSAKDASTTFDTAP